MQASFIRLFCQYLHEFELRFLRIKNRKGMPRDVFNTFATHTGLAHDVTDIVCRA